MPPTPNCFPGFGIPDELQELVKAGLTPAEALESATILPSEYFGLANDYGSLDEGKVADLVILEANPLLDITNTKQISMIVYNGNFYNRQDLNNLLVYVERMASSWSALAHMLWSQRK